MYLYVWMYIGYKYIYLIADKTKHKTHSIINPHC